MGKRCGDKAMSRSAGGEENHELKPSLGRACGSGCGFREGWFVVSVQLYR